MRLEIRSASSVSTSSRTQSACHLPADDSMVSVGCLSILVGGQVSRSAHAVGVVITSSFFRRLFANRFGQKYTLCEASLVLTVTSNSGSSAGYKKNSSKKFVLSGVRNAMAM